MNAQDILTGAITAIRSGDDAIPAVQLALAVLRAEAGELPPVELADLDDMRSESERLSCICPPGLVARGGYRGGCPEHNPWEGKAGVSAA